MHLARAVGAIGRTMIRAGVLILLFVVYQLWGTGIHTAQAQDDLAKRFKAQQEAVAAQDAANAATSTTADTVGGGTTLAPAPAAADLVTIGRGDPVGQISIPDIGAEFTIVEGVDLDVLKEGPGHFSGTPLPGQAGNAALAGHRTTYKAPFNRIDELQPGAKITVLTLQGLFTYEVMPQEGKPGEPASGHRIVNPNQTEILDDKGDNRLTLMACNPKYSATQRIVVEAKLVSNPAPPTPRTAGSPASGELVAPDNGLAGGDPSARLPALVWTFLALGVWFAAWYVGHRRRNLKWIAYAVALPFFGVLLYASFENIARLLPGAY